MNNRFIWLLRILVTPGPKPDIHRLMASENDSIKRSRMNFTKLNSERRFTILSKNFKWFWTGG